MGSGSLDAKLAELKQAEADLAVIQRQIDIARKNVDEGANFLADTDLLGLASTANMLRWKVWTLRAQIGIATPAGDLFQGLPPSDPTFVAATTILSDSADRESIAQPSLPPTEVFNTAPKPPSGDPLKVVDDPLLYQPPDFQLEHQPAADPMADDVAFLEVAATGTKPGAPPANNRLRKALFVGTGAVLFVGAGIGLAVVGSKPAPIATPPPSATATAGQPTPTGLPATPTTAPTQPLVIVGPIRYASECNGDCFMEVDPATCDRTFHFVLALLGDAATVLEGKTAIIATAGPGLQPTYEVPVVGGKVTLDAVAKGSDYGANPNAACAANASWTGLLTSVDGIPTTTPDGPT
jgi:hypothetical protein